jgi:hypothetical protein
MIRSSSDDQAVVAQAARSIVGELRPAAAGRATWVRR